MFLNITLLSVDLISRKKTIKHMGFSFMGHKEFAKFSEIKTLVLTGKKVLLVLLNV